MPAYYLSHVTHYLTIVRIFFYFALLHPANLICDTEGQKIHRSGGSELISFRTLIAS